MVDLARYSKQIEEAKESTGGTSKLPSGDYVVVCVATEEKENSKKNGHYIQNDYEIQEGEFTGEKLVDRINIDNPSERAVNIAFSTIKSLGNAINQCPLPNTEALLGKRIIATVKNVPSDRAILDDNGMQKRDDEGKLMFYPNINISKYKAYTANTKPAAAGASGGAFPFPSK